MNITVACGCCAFYFMKSIIKIVPNNRKMFQGKSKEEREALMAKLGTANFGVARSAEVPAP